MSNQLSPPSNLDAEQAVLGAILVQSDAIGLIVDELTGSMFFDPVHGRIYEACRKRFVAGQLVDGMTISVDMATDPAMEQLGGTVKYLCLLMEAACDQSTLPDYAKIIRDLYRRRVLLIAASELSAQAMETNPDNGSVDEIVARHEASLSAMALSGPKTGAAFVGHSAIQRLKSIRAEVPDGPRITTNIRELDDVIGPLGAGDLWIVGARPAMGKTAVACTIAVNVAKAGYGVIFFCLDMSAPAMTDRLLSMMVKSGRTEYRDIGRGKLRPDQQEALDKASEALGELPIIIDDRRGRNADDIASAVRRHKASLERHGTPLGLVIIDHLQKLNASQKRDSIGNETTDTVRRLKNDALSIGAPYLILSQLSRGVESRDDKRPKLSDLRDSGAIEEEADLVSFLYRDTYYLEGEKPTDFDKLEAWQNKMAACKDRLEVIAGKVRQGSRQSVRLFCDIAVNRIMTLDNDRMI